MTPVNGQSHPVGLRFELLRGVTRGTLCSLLWRTGTRLVILKSIPHLKGDWFKEETYLARSVISQGQGFELR